MEADPEAELGEVAGGPVTLVLPPRDGSDEEFADGDPAGNEPGDNAGLVVPASELAEGAGTPPGGAFSSA